MKKASSPESVLVKKLKQQRAECVMLDEATDLTDEQVEELVRRAAGEYGERESNP
jgi:hypothetical protein